MNRKARVRSVFAAVVVVALAMALAPSPAWAKTPGAIRSGFSSHTMPPTDDGSTSAVRVGFPLDFFGSTYSKLYVNNNGNVTFTGPLSSFIPQQISTKATRIIAPFWADVDTRGSGTVTYGPGTVDGRAAFGVGWINVGYYNSQTNRVNSFQLVLIDRSDVGEGDFDIELNYDKLQWEAGDASGGHGGLGGLAARAGYTSGSAGGSFEINGSGLPGCLLTAGCGQVGAAGLLRGSIGAAKLGRYLFPVRNGTPAVPLTVAKTADLDQAAAGGTNGYTITIDNPRSSDVVLSSISDTLPPGFTYVAGSTTGDVTTDPAVDGQTLTWSGVTVPGNGAVSLHFGVVVTTTPGTYFNSATATSDSASVTPAVHTAEVTVTPIDGGT